VDACLAHQCPAFVGLFHEQACYDVLGFLVFSLGPDGCTDQQQRASSGIQGLLPSTSPFDIIDDGPTSVKFKGMKTPQVSLMVWQCLYIVQAAGPAVLFFLSRRLKLAGIHI